MEALKRRLAALKETESLIREAEIQQKLIIDDIIAIASPASVTPAHATPEFAKRLAADVMSSTSRTKFSLDTPGQGTAEYVCDMCVLMIDRTRRDL